MIYWGYGEDMIYIYINIYFGVMRSSSSVI